MRGDAVGQRFPALEQADDVEHDSAECASFGELGCNRKRAIDGNTGIQKGRKFLREEKNVAAVARLKRRQAELKPALLLGADEDGNQSLALEFLRGYLLGFRGQRAGAELAIGSHGAEMEGGGHSERIQETGDRRRKQGDRRQESGVRILSAETFVEFNFIVYPI